MLLKLLHEKTEDGGELSIGKQEKVKSSDIEWNLRAKRKAVTGAQALKSLFDGVVVPAFELALIAVHLSRDTLSADLEDRGESFTKKLAEDTLGGQHNHKAYE